MIVLALAIVAIRSPLLWKTLFSLLVFAFFTSVVISDIACSCPDQQKIAAPLYAVIAATILCVNLIPAGRRRLTTPIHFDILRWQLVLQAEDTESLQFVQDRRNEIVLVVNVFVGAVAGISTFLAGVRWLENTTSDGQYTWLVICLGVIAVASIELWAIGGYIEERRLRNEDQDNLAPQ